MSATTISRTIRNRGFINKQITIILEDWFSALIKKNCSVVFKIWDDLKKFLMYIYFALIY